MNKKVTYPFYVKIALISISCFSVVFILHYGQNIILPIVYAVILAILLNPLVNLFLKKINEEYYITSTPVPELKKMEKKSIVINNLTINGSSDLTDKIGKMEVPSKFNLVLSNKSDFSIELVNTLNEKVVVGYSKDKNQFFLDRRNAGKTDFHKNFASINYAPRLSSSNEISLSIYLDLASIEVFADNGLSVLTSVLFPNEKFSKINFITSEKLLLKNFTYTPLNSIW